MKIADRGGAYQLATEELCERFAADACMLIVISGSDGTGFSACAPDDIKLHLPAIFRSIAAQVEAALATERGIMFCPVCRAPLTFNLDPRNDPKNYRRGALTVCPTCASFLTLEETWRVTTEEELADMPDEVRIELTRVRRDIQRLRG